MRPFDRDGEPQTRLASEAARRQTVRQMATRVAIVGGGGGVGASAAFNLLLRPEPYAVTLVDAARHMAISHEMDLQHVIGLGATGSVSVGDVDAIPAADVVVMCASVPLTVNRSRSVYLDGNVGILDELAEALAGWDGVLVLVTNPVDPLATWLVRRTGLPRERVLGYTLNDSVRLRCAIADRLGVPRTAVDAWMVGEHGEGAVPLWSRVQVDGRDIAVPPEMRSAIVDELRDWYVTHVALDSGRSSTWTSGHGLARMVGAIVSGDDDAPWPASIVLRGEYGLEDVAVSVPVSLGPEGARAIHEWPLADDELAGLRRAAESVRAMAGSAGP
jgi:malate dehydrogenase